VKTILTVDDSASLRQMVGFVLKGAGYGVLEAASGENALQLLTGKQVDLILTDINMPEMTGLELTRRIRELPQYKFVPVVVLTTESQSDMKQQGKAAGATAWIIKPFTPDQLLAVVKKVVR
jgi:two-component system chemotaxis response regulator CheY